MELTTEQKTIVKEAVHWFFNSSDQVFEISGMAGTGKSVVLHAIVKALHLREKEIAPCAYTGAAALVMRRKGFPKASTIHHLLYRYQKTKDYYTGNEEWKFVRVDIDKQVRLIIVDEASFCNIYIRRDLENTKCKILAAGDIRQLPPVIDSPGFLTDSSKIHELTQIMRQNEDSAIVTLSQELLSGNRIYPGNYNNEVLVIYRSEFERHFEELVKKYGIVLCGTNATRDHTNNRVREDILKYTKPLPYRGERLINRCNLWNIEVDGISLVNGLMGRCLTNPDIESFNNRTFTIDFKPEFMITPFENINVDYRYLISDHQTRRKMKDIGNSNDSKGIAKMEFAYACTTHVAQGSQFDTGIYIQEYFPEISNKLHYTGLTRFAKQAVYVIPDRKIYSHYAIYKPKEKLIPVSKVK